MIAIYVRVLDHNKLIPFLGGWQRFIFLVFDTPLNLISTSSAHTIYVKAVKHLSNTSCIMHVVLKCMSVLMFLWPGSVAVTSLCTHPI